MIDQAKAFGTLIDSARKWARSRARLRRLADSKRATPAAIKKAQRENAAAAKKLEGAVRRFDDATKGQIPRGKKKLPINWGEVAGAVAKIAGGVEQAVKSPGTSSFGPGQVEVIEVDGVPVK